MFKAILGVTVMMWVRWTLPRLRIDQVMTTCLKYCVPLAAFCFIGAMLWKVCDIPSPHDAHAYTFGRSFAETRENWVLTAERAAAKGGLTVPAGQEPQASAELLHSSSRDNRTTLAQEVQ
jgi:NADH-quinone oxidoreductase subunit H